MRNIIPKAMRMSICHSCSETRARPTQKSMPPRLSCIWRLGRSSSAESFRLLSRADQMDMERTARSQERERIQMAFEMREFQLIKVMGDRGWGLGVRIQGSEFRIED